MDTRRTLPRMRKSVKPGFTPWESLDTLLDRLEGERLLFTLAGQEVPAREVLVDFLRWCLLDGIQVGLEANTGELLVRAPVKK